LRFNEGLDLDPLGIGPLGKVDPYIVGRQGDTNNVNTGRLELLDQFVLRRNAGRRRVQRNGAGDEVRGASQARDEHTPACQHDDNPPAGESERVTFIAGSSWSRFMSV
jgi:hypothetical protein